MGEKTLGVIVLDDELAIRRLVSTWLNATEIGNPEEVLRRISDDVGRVEHFFCLLPQDSAEALARASVSHACMVPPVLRSTATVTCAMLWKFATPVLSTKVS